MTIQIPQKITLGVIEGYGFTDKPIQWVIDLFRKWPGIEIWKTGVCWSELEPKRGQFKQTFIDKIIQIMDAAYQNNAKFQFGISQSCHPQWANDYNNQTFSIYAEYKKTEYLAETWKYMASVLKDHPALDSYLIINEENIINDYEPYIIANNKIISAIRSIDNIKDDSISSTGNYKHRIVIRPNAGTDGLYSMTYQRTNIGNYGNHDFDYGTGAYTTGSQWWNIDPNGFESPISFTSYFSMDISLRTSPLILNNYAGIGEIGFMKWGNENPPWGDPEKLIGFKRALSIAYDQGFTEFIMWSSSFRFADPTTYFPLLKEFRDQLITKPRITQFNVRIIVDKAFKQTPSLPYGQKYILDPTREPYYHLVRYLDERGYSWFSTAPDSTYLQPDIYQTTISLSEITEMTIPDQDLFLQERLTGIIPNGTVYSWNEI